MQCCATVLILRIQLDLGIQKHLYRLQELQGSREVFHLARGRAWGLKFTMESGGHRYTPTCGDGQTLPATSDLVTGSRISRDIHTNGIIELCSNQDLLSPPKQLAGCWHCAHFCQGTVCIPKAEICRGVQYSLFGMLAVLTSFSSRNFGLLKI